MRSFFAKATTPKKFCLLIQKVIAFGRVKLTVHRFWNFLTFRENYPAKPGFLVSIENIIGHFFCKRGYTQLFLDKMLWFLDEFSQLLSCQIWYHRFNRDNSYLLETTFCNLLRPLFFWKKKLWHSNKWKFWNLNHFFEVLWLNSKITFAKKVTDFEKSKFLNFDRFLETFVFHKKTQKKR